MSEATVKAFRWRDKISPTEEKDLPDIEESGISDAESSTKFTDCSAEETSPSHITNNALKTASSSPILNSSDENKHPVSFMQTAKAFIQKSNAMLPWSTFHLFMSTVGSLLLVIMSLAYRMLTALFIENNQNIQEPVRTVLRSPISDSFPLVSKQTPTFSQETHKRLGIPQTFEQQRSSVVSRSESIRPQKINSEVCAMKTCLKDPVPMHNVHRSTHVVKDRSSFVGSLPSVSKCLSYFSRKSQATSQTIQLQRVSAVQRVEMVHPPTSNIKKSTIGTGSKSLVPPVYIRRTTAIVEEFWSFGSGLFRQRRRNQQQHDGKSVPEKATKKHENISREKASSNKKYPSTDKRRKEKHPRTSNTEARIHDGRKGLSQQAAANHKPKRGDMASLSKQSRNADPRWKEKHSGATSTEMRIYDGRKGFFLQAESKHGPKTGEKASPTKQHLKTHSRKEEKRPHTSNVKKDGKKGALQQVTPKGATPGKKVSSNKQHQNRGKGKKA